MGTFISYVYTIFVKLNKHIKKYIFLDEIKKEFDYFFVEKNICLIKIVVVKKRKEMNAVKTKQLNFVFLFVEMFSCAFCFVSVAVQIKIYWFLFRRVLSEIKIREIERKEL